MLTNVIRLKRIHLSWSWVVQLSSKMTWLNSSPNAHHNSKIHPVKLLLNCFTHEFLKTPSLFWMIYHCTRIQDSSWVFSETQNLVFHRHKQKPSPCLQIHIFVFVKLKQSFVTPIERSHSCGGSLKLDRLQWSCNTFINTFRILVYHFYVFPSWNMGNVSFWIGSTFSSLGFVFLNSWLAPTFTTWYFFFLMLFSPHSLHMVFLFSSSCFPILNYLGLLVVTSKTWPCC